MKDEEIRAALQDVPQEILADALAIVFTESNAPSRPVAGMDRPNLANFAQAIMYLKKHYDFEELQHFVTEADLVYVNAGERRLLLTDRMNAAPAATESSNFPSREDATFSPDGGRFSNLEI